MLVLNLEGVIVIILSNPGLLVEDKPDLLFKVLKQNKDELFILKSPK